MARISVTRANARYYVAIRGRLSALDLRALERACRHALAHKVIPLDLDLTGATAIDDVARAYLDRLRARGAIVKAGSNPAAARR